MNSLRAMVIVTLLAASPQVFADLAAAQEATHGMLDSPYGVIIAILGMGFVGYGIGVQAVERKQRQKDDDRFF